MAEDSKSKTEEKKEAKSPFERKQYIIRHSRAFVDYLNFDWKNDEKWNDFVNKNEDKISQPKTMEEARR